MASFFNRVDENEIAKIDRNVNAAFEASKQAAIKVREDRLDNYDRYGITVSDEIYEEMNKAIASSDDPEETAHRFGTAQKYSEMYGIPFSEAFEKQDDFNRALWGDKKQPAKAWYKAVSDALAMGVNNVKIGELGNKIKAAELDGDDEYVNILMNEYKALMDDNSSRQDSTPRNWAVQVLENGAQSLPYTGYSAAAAMFGSFVGGGAGGFLAGWGASTNLMAGQAYLDLRDKGVDPDIARGVSMISGASQGLVEACLGEVAAAGGTVLKAVSKGKLGGTLTTGIANKLATKLQQRFHFGLGQRMAVQMAMAYAGNLAEEGTEEAVQQLIDANTQNYAATKQNERNVARRDEILAEAADTLGEEASKQLKLALEEEYPDIELDTAGKIWGDMIEAYKGGVMGAIALGIIPTSVNVAVDAANYNAVRDAAENIPSEEMFKKIATETESGHKVFEQFEEGQERNEAIHQAWQNAQRRRDKKQGEIIADYEGTTAFGENMEQGPAELTEEQIENDEKQETIPVFRKDDGELYTNNDQRTDDDGNVTGTFKVGNGQSSKNNLYGYINYSITEKDGKQTVTINDFKTTAYRRSLQGEMFDNFAREFAGSDIVWDPATQAGKDLKNRLIASNTNGKKNGLNYYASQEEVLNMNTRKEVSKQIAKNMPRLTAAERSAAVSLLETGANRMGLSISDYVSTTFGTNIFGDLDEASQIAQAQGDAQSFKGMKGAQTWRAYGNQIKAVIYAGEKADFSTWAHEIAHVWQGQLTGDLKAEAEAAFNVKDGDWQRSQFTFADGHTESSAEAFARGFEDYLRTGKAPNSKLKELFQKFAEFFAQVYRNLSNFIDMSPEIESVYNQLLEGDDSILAAAEKAVEKADKELAAKKAADEKQRKADEDAAKKRQEEEAAAAKKADQESNAELTDEGRGMEDAENPIESVAKNDEEKPGKTAETVEQALKMLDDDPAQIVSNRETMRRLADSLSGITEESRDRLKQIIESDVSLTEKQQAIMDAAKANADNERLNMQLMGLAGVNNIAEAQERMSRFKAYKKALEIAEELKAEGKTQKEIELKVKNATNWQKNAGGNWVYETDDRLVRLNESVDTKLADCINRGRLMSLRGKSFKIDTILVSNEIFQAYPEIASIPVTFIYDDAAVLWHFDENGIMINLPLVKKTSDVQHSLMQAVQYAIQMYEVSFNLNLENKDVGMVGDRRAELIKAINEYQNENSTYEDLENLSYNLDEYKNDWIRVDAENVVRRSQMSKHERQQIPLSVTANGFMQMNYQLIGELGAARLDEADEVSTRMDNLKAARQMDKAGKDPKTTRLATGWEKGVDGKWRYEIADAKLKNIHEAKWIKRDEFFKETTVAELLDAPEYFKAYPELKDTMVMFTYTDNANGIYEGSRNIIKLKEDYYDALLDGTELVEDDATGEVEVEMNWYAVEPVRSTLLHEIQHWIQDKEGFARGSTPKLFQAYKVSPSDFAKALASYSGYTKEELEGFTAAKVRQQYLDAGIKEDELEQWSPTFGNLGNIEEVIERDIKNYGLDYTYDLIQMAAKDIEKEGKVEFDGRVYDNEYEAYGSTAGEVEARNVQARKNMSPAERQMRLLQETADVAYKDQLILFQADAAMEEIRNANDDELVEVSDNVESEALEILDKYPEAEKVRISNLFQEHKGTPWYRQALLSLKIRDDFKKVLNGEELPANSPLNKIASSALDAVKQGPEGVWTYLSQGNSFIGAAAKPINSIASSVLNCNPSKECARYCYAVKGRYAFAPSIFKGEMINWAIENDPVRAGKIAANQYKGMPEAFMGAALRILDRGDLSEQWIPFISEMNKNGVALQIFSKRAELLDKIDLKKNVINLSIDKSNVELAEKYPNLPIAFVYADKEDKDFINLNQARFEKLGGVILPVKQGRYVLKKEKLDTIPQWGKKYTCPIDAGMKEIGQTNDTWNCTKCDKFGVACFYKRSAVKGKTIPANLLEIDRGVLDERITKLKEELGKLITDERTLEAVLGRMDAFRDETLARNDTEAEGRIGESTDGSDESAEVNPDLGINFQVVTDPDEIAILEREPTVKAYRAVQLINNEIYPPMSAEIGKGKDKKLRDPIKLGIWERSDENPDMATDDGFFPLNKGNGKTIMARYNPYFHSSPETMLNDQFAEAQDRDNIVIMEVEIPARELNGENPYHAYKAKDPVGTHEWKAGIIQSQLTGTRKVNLTRWDKPVRIVPNDEVAENIIKSFNGKKIVMPSNVVTPSVRKELEARGVKFVETTNRGLIKEGPDAGKSYSKVYGAAASESQKLQNILNMQTAYHGTSAEFDKFSNEHVNEGEGSQSFGWGMYFSGSEEIARDYATRQRDIKQGSDIESTLRRAKKDLKLAEEELAELGTYDEWLAKRNEQIEKRKKEVESLKKAGTPSLWKENILNSLINNSTPEEYEISKKAIDQQIEYVKGKVDELTAKYEEAKKNKDLKRNLYTVEIPDNGFIKWEKNVRKQTLDKVHEALFRKLAYEPNVDGEYEYKGVENELRRELNDVFNSEYTGRILYGTLSSYLGGDKNASLFLNEIGYNGIDYPAGTNYGTPDQDARNYVIFADSKVKIKDHINFQTESELYADAAYFETWQEFMEYYESFGKPEVSLVPDDADAAWYESVWRAAKGLENKTEEPPVRDDQEVQQDVLDAMFMADIAEPGKLENFLREIEYIRRTDFDALGAPQDAEELADRERQQALKDVINVKLTHGSWLSNATRITKGKPLTNQTRNTLLTLMRHATREYRDIYSQITGTTEFAVPESESFFNDQMKEKLKKYHLLNDPDEVIGLSPEKMRQLAGELNDREIADRVKNGDLKMDDELKSYIDGLTDKLKAKDKELEDLKKETEQDYNRLADYSTRQILRAHEEMLKAKAKWTKKKDANAKRIEKGLKMSEKYLRDEASYKASYDNVFRKFNDLTRITKINAEIQEAFNRQEKMIQTVEEQAALKNDKAILTQIQDIRKKLVKSTMRKVKFDNIEYSHAKALIAIQRVFQPNLMNGVNQWLGEKQVNVQGTVSQYLTDVDFKEQYDQWLAYIIRGAGPKKYKKIMMVKDLLANVKSSEEVNGWTDKEIEAFVTSSPKDDWIRELNLKELDQERRDAIQMEIDENVEVKVVTDKNGKQKSYFIVHPVFSKEIEDILRDNLGEDLFRQVVYKAFDTWTTAEMEKLAKRVNDIYIEGRDELAAKRQAQKDRADEIRGRIREAVRHTGIVINSDDDDETKKAKQEQIEKILGKSSTIKGTLAQEKDKKMGMLGKLLHGYADANVMRVTRILDNYTEGANYEELYMKEDECFKNKETSKKARDEKIAKVMKDNNITLQDLFQTVDVNGLKFTVDELLYIRAANEDFVSKLEDDPMNGTLELNDHYAATARNAVMFGNLYSSDDDVLMKEHLDQMDVDMELRIAAGNLTAEEEALKEKGQLITEPGTETYIGYCIDRMRMVLKAANELDPKFKALQDAIEADYDENYERMTKISIDEFNAPVDRVKKYVPLVRLESNGDTNENRVKEDVLAVAVTGATMKQWADKGMTKKRKKMSPLHQKPVEMGLYKTWADSVERTEHFIAYAGYVRELNRVYKSRDAQYTRRFIENRYGKGMLQYIDSYINEVANPNAAEHVQSSLEGVVKMLRGKTSSAYLAWKTSGVIKQAATSPWPYMQYVTPQEYLKACFDIIASKGSMYDTIKEKSVFMASRVADPMYDMISQMNDEEKNKFIAKLNEFNNLGMQGLEWIDWACVSPGWLAVYRREYERLEAANDFDAIKAEVIAENDMLPPKDRMTSDQIEAEAIARQMDEDEIEDAAVQKADDATRACQPSSRAADLAPLFKDTNQIAKAFLQFQTSLNVIWQNLRYDIPYAVRNKQFKQIVGTIVGYTLAGILMNSIVEGYDDTDDDDKDLIANIRKFMYYATTQFSDAIPVIGSVISNLNAKVIGGNKGYTSSSADLTPMLTKIFDGTKMIPQAMQEPGKWTKIAGKYAEAAGLATGLPVSGAKEILQVAGVGDEEGPKPEALWGRR